MSEKVFKVVVIAQITERVWYEVTGVESATEAITAYQKGEGTITDTKHLSTDYSEVEDVYQEDDHAV